MDPAKAVALVVSFTTIPVIVSEPKRLLKVFLPTAPDDVIVPVKKR